MTHRDEPAGYPLSRRSFLRSTAVLGAGFALCGLAGCAPALLAAEDAPQPVTPDETPQPERAEPEASPSDGSSTTPASGRQLVLVFSRPGENYGVGIVEKGNTLVEAEMIRDKTGADLFELKPVEPYPEGYEETVARAHAERDAGARPELEALPDLSGYDVVYLGFPIWSSNAPMPLYTAMEALDWNGLTIAPFSTYAVGDAGMFAKLEGICEGATVLEGLSLPGVTVQNDRDATAREVDAWLSSLPIV